MLQLNYQNQKASGSTSCHTERLNLLLHRILTESIGVEKKTYGNDNLICYMMSRDFLSPLLKILDMTPTNNIEFEDPKYLIFST